MLPDATRPQGATLRVRDLDRVRAFYEHGLGLKAVSEETGSVLLSVPGAPAWIRLDHAPNAPKRQAGSEGLFHIAFLVPTREDLSRILRRFRARQTPLQGAADHAVSEAIYLQDPEGNGLEIYRDRPREDWPWRQDEVMMVTDPLDVDDLFDLTSKEAALPGGTRLGHVHLQTLELENATRFYEGLGLTLMQSTFPGARFLSMGGYHHHIGVNEWNVRKAREDEAAGLTGMVWSVPEGSGKRLAASIEREHVATSTTNGTVQVEDRIGIVHTFQEGADHDVEGSASYA